MESDDPKSHKRNTSGLKPFVKGQSGNPAGRPKNQFSLTALMRQKAQERCEHDPKGRTWGQVLVDASWQQAIKGNAAVTREIWNRLDGQVRPDVNSPSQGPAVLEVVYVDSPIRNPDALAKPDAMPDTPVAGVERRQR